MPETHDWDSRGSMTGVRETPIVLLIEDDPDTRHFYRSLLSTHGFSIDEAHNGFQAFEKAVAAPPDLVLTDIAVPGLDGIELCRRLRADARTRHVPALAITGYDDRRYPDRVMLAGANQFLRKPIDPDVLLMEVRRLLATAALIRVPSRPA